MTENTHNHVIDKCADCGRLFRQSVPKEFGVLGKAARPTCTPCLIGQPPSDDEPEYDLEEF